MTDGKYTIKYNGVPIEVNAKVNSKLDTKNKLSSKLKKRVAAFGLAITIGLGTLAGCSIFKHFQNQNKTAENDPNNSISTTSVQLTDEEANELKAGLNFDPNSPDSIIDKAAFLIEDAAKGGKTLDVEDAVLSVIVANSNEITPGFMGQLFGERADQTYTYGALVDAFLRVGMMQVENVGVAKDADIAFNVENVFASKEDHDYLYKIRDLITRFNNSTDEAERNQITTELNQMAFDLCTYEAYDISSPARVLAMLSLDGMHMVTNNSSYPILPDDIRDEMFGNGDYACRTEGTYTSESGQVHLTAYSDSVGDLKLDAVGPKLDNAILPKDKTSILNDIFAAVRERTKFVGVSDFEVVDEINRRRDEYRDGAYKYEIAPGVENPNYSEINNNDTVGEVNGKPVIIVEGDTVKPTAPTGDTGVAENKAEAENKLVDEQAKLQEESNKGAVDGKYYGENGLPKPSLDGKSQAYITAFNKSYDAYKAIYDAQHSTEPDELVDSQFQPTDESKETTSTTEPTTEETKPVEEESKTQPPVSTPNNNLVGSTFVPVKEEVVKVEVKEEVKIEELQPTSPSAQDPIDLGGLSRGQLLGLKKVAVGAVENTQGENEKTR